MFSVILFYLFICYPKKVIILLLIEFLFLCCFFIYFYLSFIGQSGIIFFSFLMLIFLVLDSVFSVSVLLSISRGVGPHSSWFFYWLDFFVFFSFFSLISW